MRSLLIIFSLLVACATAPPSPLALKTPQVAVVVPLASVAVMAFEDHSIGMPPAKTQGLGMMLADKISEQILMEQATIPPIRLVDRDSLQKVLEELSLGSSEITHAESRLRLGKLLGANYFIMGGFTAMGEGVRIDGRIVSVETGEVEGRSVQGKFSDWVALEGAISKQLVDLLIAKTSAKKELYE